MLLLRCVLQVQLLPQRTLQNLREVDVVFQCCGSIPPGWGASRSLLTDRLTCAMRNGAYTHPQGRPARWPPGERFSEKLPQNPFPILHAKKRTQPSSSLALISASSSSTPLVATSDPGKNGNFFAFLIGKNGGKVYLSGFFSQHIPSKKRGYVRRAPDHRNRRPDCRSMLSRVLRGISLSGCLTVTRPGF